MSEVSRCAKSKAPFGEVGSPTSMPSTITLVWLELVPRMNTEVCPPGPPVCTTFKPGTVFSASGRVRYCWVAISWAVMAVIEFATWLVGVTIPVGLTTVGAVFGMPCCGVVGFSAGFCWFGLAAACRDFGFCAAGGCVVSGFLAGLTSIGGSRLGEADCWPCAAGIAKGDNGISTVDASHRLRRARALVIERMVGPR